MSILFIFTFTTRENIEYFFIISQIFTISNLWSADKTVKAASPADKNNYKEKDITIHIGKGRQELFRVPYILLYRNNKAKYTYVSSSKNLIFKENFELITDKKTKYKDIRNSIIADAKKTGTAVVAISYGKLSETCKVTVYESEEALLQSKEQKKNWLGTTFKMKVNSTMDICKELTYPSLTDSIYLEGDGFDILDKNSIVYTDNNNSYYFYAGRKGKAKINVYEYDTAAKTKGDLIGSFFIEVTEPVTKELRADEIVLSKYTIETYLDVNSYGKYESLCNNSNYFQWAVFPPPEDWDLSGDSGFEVSGNFSGSNKLREKTSITFSDPEILTLRETIGDNIDDDEGHLLIIPKKAGKTTITFQCDNVSASCDVTIYANKAAYEKAVENRPK